MIYLLFPLILLISSFSLFAKTEIHAITPTINFSVEQDSTPGFGLSYQYPLKQSIELDIGLQNSNALYMESSEGESAGEYQSFLFGANLIKSFDNNLSIKIGSGASYILNSSNSLLVEEQSLSPYLKLSLDYKLSDAISIVIGQTSQFNKGQLDSDHQLVFGLSWIFSSNKAETIIRSTITSDANTQNKPAAAITPSIFSNSDAVPNSNQNEIKLNELSTTILQATQQFGDWYIQFGAYSSRKSAELALSELEAVLDKNIAITVVFHNNLYRLLSRSFETTTLAKTNLQQLIAQYAIDGFVSHIQLSQ